MDFGPTYVCTGIGSEGSFDGLVVLCGIYAFVALVACARLRAARAPAWTSPPWVTLLAVGLAMKCLLGDLLGFSHLGLPLSCWAFALAAWGLAAAARKAWRRRWPATAQASAAVPAARPLGLA